MLDTITRDGAVELKDPEESSNGGSSVKIGLIRCNWGFEESSERFEVWLSLFASITVVESSSVFHQQTPDYSLVE